MLIIESKSDRVSLVGRDFSKCFRFFPRLATATRGRGVGYKAEQRERQVELSAKWSSRGDGTTEKSRRERHEWHMERWQLFAPLFSLPIFILFLLLYSFAKCHYSHTIHPKYLRSNWFLWVPRKTLSGPSFPIKNCLKSNIARDLTLICFRTL